jgi:hypothetical protein
MQGTNIFLQRQQRRRKKVVLEFSPELESLSRTVPVLASCRFLPTSPLFEISGRLEVGIVAENGRKNWLPPWPRADVIKRFSLSVVVDDVASNNLGCSSLSTFTQKLCLLNSFLVKDILHYDENRAKLVGFKEQKKIFCNFKNPLA